MIYLDYMKVLIESPQEWQSYIKDLSNNHLGGLRHLDDPTSYPCIVMSVVTNNIYGQDECYHRFVSQEEAHQLARLNLHEKFEEEILNLV